MTDLNNLIKSLNDRDLAAVLARDYAISEADDAAIDANFDLAFDLAIAEQAQRLAHDWDAFAEGIDPDATTFDGREAFLAAPLSKRIAMAEEAIRMNLKA